MNKSTKRYKMKKIKIPNKKDYIESNILYKVLIISFFLLAIPVAVSAQSKETGLLLNKYNIKQIIGAMTLEEKASLVVGTGMSHGGDGPVIGDAGGYIPGAAGYTASIPRLGIHSMVLADGPAGIRIHPVREGDKSRTYHATAWPVGTLLASSWDRDLLKEVGTAFGEEIKEYGIDIILGPGMNIQRDPLNGRNFEYYSEDPYLTGYLASAIVEGIQSNGVGACLKHFAANNQETSRGSIDVIVSERALREIYLRGFEIAVKKSNPWSIMSAYNKINGSYASENYDLLTKIPRDDWGYKGLLMTDWYAGRNTIAQVKAGTNLIEPGGERYKNLILKAIEDGELDPKDLDKNVEYILNTLLLSPSNNKYCYSNIPDLKSHALVARDAAAESFVLLKNKEALPLKEKKNIALFGTASYNTYIGGTGSGDVYEAYSVSISEGLVNSGNTLNKEIYEIYNKYIEQEKIANANEFKPGMGTAFFLSELNISENVIEKAATESEIAIFTIGRNAGEGEDRKIDDFLLSDMEKSLIKQIARVFHAQNKKVIILINSGGVVETVSWKDQVDAVLLVWQPGQEGGNAVADVLSGKVNPSGKLPMTFPVRYQDIPSSKNFPGTPENKPKKVIYEEGIYVGYRYFNSFDIEPSFPFGYGLSYTLFEYSNIKLSSSTFDDSIQVQVMIKNTGKTSGKEVVQLYLSAPVNRIDKPNEELKGFAKTKLLSPGESETISFVLKATDLASFDTQQTAWIADAGEYKIKIGSSCKRIEQMASFNLAKDVVVEKVNKALSPLIPINELKK